MSPFVPPGFVAPTRLETRDLLLEPLGPEHNERDFAAWTSSIEHIRATPGFGEREGGWPQPMTLDENLADLEMHARHFAAGEGFTYTVLDPATQDVVGCVYIYPDEESAADAHVRSWVRVSSAELDVSLWGAVSAWLTSDAWPFERIRYAERPGPPAQPS